MADPAWTNESSNWLKSRFHFSFAEYNNHHNSNFGVLRVMNDDLVQPHRGFGTHPHRNMEVSFVCHDLTKYCCASNLFLITYALCLQIITYVVHGELSHKDSMGTEESLGRGSIQFMTAGTGVMHSEFNDGDKPLRFIQTWIVPSKGGLEPNYGSCRGSNKEDRLNKWQHLVSNVKDSNTSTPVEINQDVDGYATELQNGQTVTFELPEGRQAYLLCVEGGVKVNGEHQLEKHDACEITGPAGMLKIEANKVEPTENGDLAHLLMFVMQSEQGAGRTDF